MPPSKLNVQSFSPQPIDRPVHFVSGPFANRTVRAELEELQKADLGRKCGNRDRRPLDPPPVVRLRLFETINEGTPQETENEITDVNSEAIAYGFICFVDLFPWPPPPVTESGSQSEQQQPPQAAARVPGPSSEMLPSLASLMTQLATGPTPRFVPGNVAGPSLAAAGPSRPPAQLGPVRGSIRPDDSSTVAYGLPPPRALLPMQPLQSQPPSGQHIAAIVDGVLIQEQANCTHAFVGATFVSASSFNYDGKPSLLFVFPDLACNMDGTFLLRYRAMNLFGAALETNSLPILAECWGGPVVLYPTKDFPGLAESTELTKFLSRFGVPVNIRQGERKKRPRRGEESKDKDNSGPSNCAP
ncbi:hypothetical protein DAEQUDRAFT_729781 [Daedalea quercina L-15889]|uniref:Velvet domain-containing protein n=1 Tax=Daedalea quercina L-15889 TaxID=1314783 RepID=A0A165NCT1_9APHY|nr:hypothetical protein DAEQUDRAFT_729781 [Daedalea quercina L-15889]